MTSFSFHNPVTVCFGRGVADGLAERLERPALLVAGRATLARTGLGRLVDGDGVVAFDGVPPNPSPAVVDEGAAAAEALGARTVVGIGGGSAQDAAKCIAVLVGNDTSIRSFQGRCRTGETFARRVRLVQVPTTAGTGSEVTRWASLWSEDGHKSSMDDASGYAEVALVDPALTEGMGARLTATTGLDAMAHALEAIWGVHHNPISDVHAERALRLIGEHLPACVHAGAAGASGEVDRRHRDGMALAALHAGLALSNTRTAAAHALSYALTGGFGVEHGLAVGLLCRGLLPINARWVPDRIEAALAALGAGDVTGFARFVDDVLAAAGLPASLESLGVPRAAHASIVATAAGADRLENNPGPLTEGDLHAVLEAVA